MDTHADADPVLRITKPERPWPDDRIDALRRAVGGCADVAFAHLPEVFVEGHGEPPRPVLFVWLVPGALRSLRKALNLVCAAAASAMPKGEYVDVIILNSNPSLLGPVERADCLLIERDPAERAAALAADRDEPAQAHEPDTPPTDRPWWAFWRSD